MNDNEFELKLVGEFYQFKLNKNVYPLDIVVSAANVALDRAYIFLDEDERGDILVNMRPKDDSLDKKKFVLDFSEDLLNYLEYKSNLEKNKHIREMILQRAIITNDFEVLSDLDDEDDTDFDKIFDDDELESIEDIAKPWEEKYGKDSNLDSN